MPAQKIIKDEIELKILGTAFLFFFLLNCNKVNF